MPTRGSHVGPPGSEGSAAGAPFPSVFGSIGPLGNSGTAACNPVPPNADPSCNLTYHGGSVMLTSTTHLVFWAPSGYSFPAGYTALLQQYLDDVAHDSGYATFTDAVSTQYYDNLGGTHYITTNSPHGVDYTDTTAYPSQQSGCNNAGGSTICLTESQERNELDSVINSIGGTRGLNDIWFIVLPPQVQTCYDDDSWCGPYGPGTSGNGYCAYHNSFTGGYGGSATTVWANMPYDPGAGGGCPNQQPNGNSADVTIDVLSHEMNEAMTDPNGGGWWDGNTTNGGENGDQCNFVYGASIGTTTSGSYDELINGHPYRVQQEWSNADLGCAMFYGAVAPTASFTYSPGSPTALQTVSFDGSGSSSNDTGGSIVDYSWSFGDGHSGSGVAPTHAYAASGSYLVTLTVEDSAAMTDSTSQYVVVVTRPTTVTYTGDTSGTYSDTVTLSATLTDDTSATGVAGEQLSFTLGAESCNATTDSLGVASCTVTPTDLPGPYTAAVSFAGDSVYSASDDSSAFTLDKEDTQVTYTGATTVHYHDAVTLSATLTDPDDSAGIGGRTVGFTLSGGDHCSGTTASDGSVSCTLTAQTTGDQTLTTSFGGDDYYLASSTTDSFSVTPEETTISYTGPTVILAGSGSATLSATLLEDGSGDNDSDPGSSAPSPAQTVTLSLGTQSCSALTDASGDASCTIPSVGVPLGPETIVASSEDTAYYQGATDTADAVVFAFPQYGAFTLGDQTVAAATASTTVTWWADDWWTLNLLTAGSAPPSDKGFAGNVTLPTTTPVAAGMCTPDWTTTGGNSPPPTSGVPSYMGVLVTSHVTKHGRRIAGDTVHIVVVKTDPGYGPAPMYHGTGTIVATYC